MAGRSEHGCIAVGAAAIAVRGGVGLGRQASTSTMMPPTRSTNSVAPMSSGATSWTLRSKKPGGTGRRFAGFASQHLLLFCIIFTTFDIFAASGHERRFSATGLHDFHVAF